MNKKWFKHWNRGVVHSQIRCTDLNPLKTPWIFFGFFGFFFGLYEDFLSEQPLVADSATLTWSHESNNASSITQLKWNEVQQCRLMIASRSTAIGYEIKWNLHYDCRQTAATFNCIMKPINETRHRLMTILQKWAIARFCVIETFFSFLKWKSRKMVHWMWAVNVSRTAPFVCGTWMCHLNRPHSLQWPSNSFSNRPNIWMASSFKEKHSNNSRDEQRFHLRPVSLNSSL